MNRILVLSFFMMTVTFSFAQYNVGEMDTAVIDEDFYNEVILTDSERNKNVVTENMTLYNQMVNAYNTGDYETALYYNEKTFYGSIGEKIQFTVYFKKYEKADVFRQNLKVILFMCLMQEKKPNVKELREVYFHIEETCTPDRFDFIHEQAIAFNESSDKQIDLEE
ncbi:MAG: hypothetical protein ACPG4Z_06820 [Chitinophagales bacterium]